MKREYIVVGILIIANIFLIVTLNIEREKESQLQQSTIDGLRKHNAKEKDSLQSQLAITRDSLEVAFATIRQARIESQEAHERTQRIIKNYEKIIYVSFSTDAQRDSALSKLYPSFRPIR